MSDYTEAIYWYEMYLFILLLIYYEIVINLFSFLVFLIILLIWL